MLRSMYSAVSGMQGFQTQLDVIGNNIANVDTVGFKAGRVDFADILSQTMSGGSTPSVTATNSVIGGTNPQQIGLGMKVAAINTLFTQGADQTTGVATDLAINGDGLFVVTTDGGKTLNYTRAGNFNVDANGSLILPNGAVAMGYPSTSTTGSGSIPASSLQPVNLSKFMPVGTSLNASPDLQIGQNGSLTVTDTQGNRTVIGYLVLATPPNPAGMQKVGDNLFALSPDSGSPTVGTNTNYFQTPTQNNTGYLQTGALEMSNVDLTTEFTNMITAQRGFDATSHIIGTDNAVLNDIVNLKNS